MKIFHKIVLVICFVSVIVQSFAQSDNCKLSVGTNLSGISDWMTEMPFVDMMHNVREWGTRNRSWIGDGAENTWNTDLINLIDVDEQGYPIELPFFQENLALEDSQMVFAVWADISAWEPGVYVLLYDGEGEIDFKSDGTVISREPGRLEVQVTPSENYFLEMDIIKSVKENHIRNIRFLMPGHENTYSEQPFNPLYLEILNDFSTLRFMDWGHTNNWGESEAWECYNEPEDTILIPWNVRSQMDNYTWSIYKGVPYEMMCKLCNSLQKDMWICVPHNASDEYIREMALLVKEQLDSNLIVYAEYSNELWNWMFGQTQWLYTFFCEGQGVSWPEGLVGHIQNCLDIWNDVFSDNPNRLVTVAGGQTAWLDVTNRIVKNLTPGSFDALNITGYFALGDDTVLDELGEIAAVTDVVNQVRGNMQDNAVYISNQHDLAQELGVPLVFYEAGQHITPTPFGEEPSYSQALLDIQRDTALYNLYHEWFSIIKNILSDDEQALYMNYSFVGDLSACYGSWGILETLNQDTAEIYAPKYHAITDLIKYCGKPENTSNPIYKTNSISTFRIIKRYDKNYTIINNGKLNEIVIYSINGKILKSFDVDYQSEFDINLDNLSSGYYIVCICDEKGVQNQKLFVD